MLKKFGEFELDGTSRRLTQGGEPVRLTGQALDLLCLFVERPGELLSREEIKHRLWPDSSADLEHSLDVLLNRLRAILGDSGRVPRFIETVPRKGYRLLADVRCEQPAANKRIGNLARILWTYAVIALLAAMIAVLIARTRYQRFVPPRPVPVSANLSAAANHFS
jgi:DNA-binding winged helix-turn-helix (wHTH) protein